MSWDHKGIRIEVNQHGQFQFQTPGENGATCFAKSLTEAQEEVEKYLKAGKPKDLDLKGWVVKETIVKGLPSRATYSVVQVDILGVNGTTGELRLKPSLTSDNIEVGIFPDIEGMQEKLEAYVKAKSELESIVSGLRVFTIPQRYGYGRVPAGEMQRKLDELASDYGVARIGKSTGRGRG